MEECAKEYTLLQILIENGANIESRDNDSWTPLHLAAAENSVEVTKVGRLL